MLKKPGSIIIFASVILFFIQGLQVAFSVLFGIIYDQVFEGPMDSWLILSTLILFIALILPGWLSGLARPGLTRTLVLLTLAARISMTINNPLIRYWSAIVVLLAAGSIILTLFTGRPRIFAVSLGMALLLEQLLRVAGDTYSLNLRPDLIWLQIIWSVLIGFLLLRLPAQELILDETPRYPGFLTSLGLGGFLFIETSLLCEPHVIARWSDVELIIIAPLLMIATLLPFLPSVRHLFNELFHARSSAWITIALFMLALLVGYNYSGWIAAGALCLAQTLALLLIISMLGHVSRRKNRPLLGSLAFISLVILNFLNAFAFTYPYVLPCMREMGWAVYLSAAFLLAIAFILQPIPLDYSFDDRHSFRTISASFGIAILITFISLWPQAPVISTPSESLRAATYNIHYGFDDDWNYQLDAMADLIRSEKIDIIALQEVDAGRMTSYMVDNAYYLARTLDMNVTYLPTVEHLTGIALLYHGVETSQALQLLPSLQEQTGIIHVQLNIQEQPLHAYAIWMGLSDEDTQSQIDAALTFIGAHTPAVFGGDFNAQYEDTIPLTIRDAGFRDPFTTLGITPPPTSPAIEPDSRIDFVWMRDLNALKAWVPVSIVSDHRMVVAEFGLP